MRIKKRNPIVFTVIYLQFLFLKKVSKSLKVAMFLIIISASSRTNRHFFSQYLEVWVKITL